MSVGILHPGEMGASIGAALRACGHEVLWASDGRSRETARRAADAGLKEVGSISDLLARAEVVLSICPPAAAADVAERVAKERFVGIFVDANAIAPTTATAVNDVVAAGGARFVDGDIIGGPPRPGGTTRLYLSGADAPQVATLLHGSDQVEAIVLGSGDTAASALKMCYAAWTKGTSALLLAIRAVAAANGIEDDLLAEWQRTQPDLAARSEVARGPKAWRFGGEMREIAQCFRDSGLPDGFAEAAAEVFDRLASIKGSTRRRWMSSPRSCGPRRERPPSLVGVRVRARRGRLRDRPPFVSRRCGAHSVGCQKSIVTPRRARTRG